MPKNTHSEIQALADAKEHHHFLLTTDGSGHDATKKATGSAWVLRTLNATLHGGSAEFRGCSGCSHGTVQRAELQALLDGLSFLARELGVLTLSGAAKFCGIPLSDIAVFPRHSRVKVWWEGDRETVILQVARRRDGTTYYARKEEMDLWQQMRWFEHVFDITAAYVPRNTTQDQKDVDARAGEVRGMFLEK